MKLEPLGDTAVVATLGTGIDPATLASVRSYSEALVAAGLKGVTDVVPAYATVTVFYDAARFADSHADAYEEVCSMMKALEGKATAAAARHEARRVDIPVCYGGDFGPDLPALARHCGLSEGDAAELHAGADYLVHAIGFTPGFAYLGGLPENLRMPRRPTPRSHVPAGSVAIGGSQTGVYPVASAGRLADHRADADGALPPLGGPGGRCCASATASGSGRSPNRRPNHGSEGPARGHADDGPGPGPQGAPRRGRALRRRGGSLRAQGGQHARRQPGGLPRAGDHAHGARARIRGPRVGCGLRRPV